MVDAGIGWLSSCSVESLRNAMVAYLDRKALEQLYILLRLIGPDRLRVVDACVPVVVRRTRSRNDLRGNPDHRLEVAAS